MESRQVKPASVFTFIPHKRHKTLRWMAVIQGVSETYAFYRSTGLNSHWEGTWFICRGVDSHGWVRKCRVHTHSRFMKFCKQHDIPTQHLQSRFGSTEAICISASLGGGFWETEKGIQVKKYYLEKKASYFLADEKVQAILRQVKVENPDYLCAHHHINQRLRTLKVVIPASNKSPLTSLTKNSLFVPPSQQSEEKVKAPANNSLSKSWVDCS